MQLSTRKLRFCRAAWPAVCRGSFGQGQGQLAFGDLRLHVPVQFDLDGLAFEVGIKGGEQGIAFSASWKYSASISRPVEA